jgi:FHS family L-fucose permease-like MFS transporter
LLALGIVFALAKLPHVEDSPGMTPPDDGTKRSILSYRNLVLGAIAIFLYVGGEVSIGSFLVSYMGEGSIAGLPAAVAGKYVSYYWGGAMVGRFIGFVVLSRVSPGRVLAFNACSAIGLLLVAILGHGAIAMWAILGVGLFNSIMFPTIFSMALHKLGPMTGQGSGVLCMAIVGGAIVPLVQGAFADRIGLQFSFFVPIVCYAYILFFGVKYARLYLAPANAPVT